MPVLLTLNAADAVLVLGGLGFLGLGLPETVPEWGSDIVTGGSDRDQLQLDASARRLQSGLNRARSLARREQRACGVSLRAEVVTDFFDQMKTRTQGYASMEYHLIGYRKNELVRLDVLINAERADPLTTIVHRDKAYNVGKGLVEKLKELIPRQQFKIPLLNV